MKIDGGEMFARMLEQEEIDVVFGLHGGHIDPIFQACLDHDIRIIDTRHEQAAGHMADAWARLTGKAGVVVVTAGPGVTDVVTAVANAYMDCVPMLVVGGRHGLDQDELMPLQELHGVALMQSITKWNRLVHDPARIPEYTALAFKEATTGRPGPVFLEIPMDVLNAWVEEDQIWFPSDYLPKHAASPSPKAVEEAMELLCSAERPVILAGRGVWYSRGAHALRSFSELAGIPVCANGITRGAVPEDTSLGVGGFHVAGAASAFGQPPDVVMLLGARLGLYTGLRGSSIPKDARIIQVDVEPEEIGRGRDIHLGIAADCREFLLALTRALEGRDLPDWSGWVEQLQGVSSAMMAPFEEVLQEERVPVHPFRLAHEVSAFVERSGVLVADGGETFVWAQMARRALRPGRALGHGYLGCLGTGIPFGMAAKVVLPEEPVVVLTGDGSVGLNFSEFDTAVRHNLPIVVVVNNDRAWGMCKHEQELRLGKDRVVATELGPVRYERAAEAFGVYGELVESPSGIRPALERASQQGRPACINVMTDPEAVTPLVQMGSARQDRPWAESVRKRR